MTEVSISSPKESATSPRSPARSQTRALVPRSFSDKSWRNFHLDQSREYLALIPGNPTVRQLATIEAMVLLKFNAHKRGKEARRLTGREAREAAREARADWSEYHKRLADFERTLAKAPQPASMPPIDALEYGRQLAARARGEAAE
jgi:hypothetical protein